MALAQAREIPSSVEWIASCGPVELRRPAAALSAPSAQRDRCFELHGDFSRDDSCGYAQRDQLSVAFDGHLDNREELERALSVAKQTTDAELLLQAYHRWGVDLLSQIKGVFALVVWDVQRDRLLAARDAVGIYPLFYASVGPHGLLLSTSINDLLGHPKVSRALNRAALADNLCQRWPDPGETFFAAVRRVPPGHRLLLDGDRLEITRYWDPLPPGKAVNWVTEEELEGFDGWLETAAERALRHGPSAVFLSGGLDSTSVAMAAADVAARTRRPTPLALSLGFPDPCDESPIQRGVAAALGMPQEFVPFWSAVPTGTLLSRALRLSCALAAPLRSAWAPVYHDLAERGKRRGARVVLTGLGGDELLGANPLYAADLLRRGNLLGLGRQVARWRRSYPLPTRELLRTTFWTYGLRPLGVSALERAIPGVLNRRRIERSMRFAPDFVAPGPDLRADLERRVTDEVERETAKAALGGDLHVREARMQLDRPTFSWHMEESFERGRQLGLTFLHPLLEADLADKLYRTPQPLLSGDGRAKYLVRRRLVERFPNLGLDRQKKLAATPFFRATLASELPDLCRSMAGFPTLSKLGVVDGRLASSMVEAALRSADRRGLGRVWELLNVEAWAGFRL
jgi:asparagine synthase (glutamine-hydrolysing)